MIRLKVAVSPVNDATFVLIPPVILGRQVNIDRALQVQSGLELVRILLSDKPRVAKLDAALAVRRGAPVLTGLVRVGILILQL